MRILCFGSLCVLVWRAGRSFKLASYAAADLALHGTIPLFMCWRSVWQFLCSFNERLYHATLAEHKYSTVDGTAEPDQNFFR